MSYSLNEMEATTKRAARGAGYPWGLAEDAAKAARWLCTQGLDGSAEMARVLERGFAEHPAKHRPQSLVGVWRSEGDLCPISAGALLSDCAQTLKAAPIEMRHVVVPSVLLPFAASAAKRLGGSVRVTFDDVVAMTDGTHLELQGELPGLVQRVVVSQCTETVKPNRLLTRSHLSAQSWDVLNSFAHKTYAPATEESRALGAGAGLSDND
ncbi:Protein of unknown function [Aliiroseovarius crassostreae]|uniref:DUF3726 domain-containing protein n=1 Tax=Aliiroseovarius crassostreae TaxID=154981 RepID=A0A0P7IET1_9RHOB|nr:DUF3726 domain-containing protein [Aliiroseovarius crassostreae]KPN62482.1 hypothetical protein AKJ29_09675 [Aliiroseovarius crassostreae]SFU82421.1 Protein of unknown function [Aliiroseovarius crassostreae]